MPWVSTLCSQKRHTALATSSMPRVCIARWICSGANGTGPCSYLLPLVSFLSRCVLYLSVDEEITGLAFDRWRARIERDTDRIAALSDDVDLLHEEAAQHHDALVGRR